MLLTSQIFARGYLRSVVFFPVLVITVGVGITFTALMHPTQGVINETLELFGINGPGWLTDPQLALLSVALVDVWKGVGLATVIYMAGIASINRRTITRPRRSTAQARLQNFWNITLPLVRPATVTVIILLLIGGLRSFDLIWAMTRGGPGFTSDVDGVGDLQAVPGRLLRALDRRQRRPLRRRRRDHRAAQLVAEPQAGEL